MEFKDRERELEFLEKEWKGEGARFLVLYGRRRIGKTELIKKFTGAKPNIYFLARREAEKETIKRLNNKLIEVFNDKSLISAPLIDLSGFFDYLSTKTDTRFLLVIDEFPFMIERFSDLPSILQDIWDNKLKNTQIFIIISGSSVSMIEENVLGYKSPLYGRRTHQWRLDGIEFKYLKYFFPKYSLEDLIKVYSAIDTIPGYLTKFDPDKPIMQNIIDQILKKGSFLYEEVEFVLNEELRDPSNYMTILSAIASGASSFSEISNQASLDKSLISKYLNVLERMQIVKKSFPIAVSFKKVIRPSQTHHKIADNFFSFWFRFVYPYKDQLEYGKIDFVTEILNREYNTYLGYIFEKICIDFFLIDKRFGFQKVGSWWHKDKEIDVIAIDEMKKRIAFVECKWKDDVNANEVLKKLKDKAEFVDWNREKRLEEFYIVAKSFQEKLPNCFDLDDLGMVFL